MQYTVAQPVDTLIQGTKVFDGLGNEARTCDVAINADRIVAIGELTSLLANEVIVGIDHEMYAHTTKLTDANRKALALDFT